MNITFKTKMALFIAIVLWASAYVGIRAGLHGYSPGALGLFRYFVASICMYLIYLRLPSTKETIKWRDRILLLLVGALGIGIYNIALNFGEVSVSSGISCFIVSQSPIITTALAVIFLREKINKFVIFGMFISLMGVFLMTLNQNYHFDFDLGILYVVIAAILGSIYTVSQKPFLGKYHVIEVTAYVIWGATLVLSVYFPDLFRECVHAPLSSTLASIYLGIFPAAIAYVAWSYALNEIPASRAMSFLYFSPIITTFLGWILLNEIPLMVSFVGGLIAMVGVWVVNKYYYMSS